MVAAESLFQPSPRFVRSASRGEMREVHAHGPDPDTPGNEMALGRRAQLVRRVLGVCDVMIEKWKVEPLHVCGTKRARERWPADVRPKVIVHSFAAKPDDHGSEIQRPQKAPANERAEVVE